MGNGSPIWVNDGAAPKPRLSPASHEDTPEGKVGPLLLPSTAACAFQTVGEPQWAEQAGVKPELAGHQRHRGRAPCRTEVGGEGLLASGKSKPALARSTRREAHTELVDVPWNAVPGG